MKRARRYQRPSHALLDEIILAHLGCMVPVPSMELYDRVLNDYGSVIARTFYRHVDKLTKLGQLVRHVDVDIEEIKPRMQYCYTRPRRELRAA